MATYGSPWASALGGRLVYSNLFGVTTGAQLVAAYTPDYVVLGENPAGATQSLVTNNGGALQQQITSGNSVGGYADQSCVQLMRCPILKNLEVLACANVPSGSTEQFFFVNVRSDAVYDGGTDLNCYSGQWVCNGGDGNLNKQIAGAFTFLGQDDQTATAADWWIRMFVRGTTLGIRTWRSSGTVDAEPSRWSTVIDADLPGRGFVTVGLTGGNSGTQTWVFNLLELHVWDLDQPNVGAIAR